nr:hypothetical protein [Oxalobacteraceae bacterium]
LKDPAVIAAYLGDDSGIS